MKSRMITFALLLIFATTPGHSYTSTSSTGPLEGAWKSVGDQPGLLLFTGEHYSWMVVNQPRELFSDPANPTEAEWLSACTGITANSGSYEVSGSAFRLQIKVAKHPNAMASQQVATFEYSIEADTLRVKFGGGSEQLFVRLE